MQMQRLILKTIPKERFPAKVEPQIWIEKKIKKAGEGASRLHNPSDLYVAYLLIYLFFRTVIIILFPWFG